MISPEEAKHQTGITDHNGVVIATGVGDHTDVGSGFPWDHFQKKLDEYAAEVTPGRAARGLAGPAYPGLTIAQGVTGRHVITVQERLNTVANAGLLVDGVFGPLTARALTAFQKTRGLVADGQAGPKTWAQLFADRQPSAEQPFAPTVSGTRGAVAPPAGGPDSFPLPAQCYWGPLDGPGESWSNLSGDEPQYSKDGLKRWQEMIGVAGSAVYDDATKEAAARMQALHGWRPVKGTVCEREWDEVVRRGWRLPALSAPKPGSVASPAGYEIGWYPGPGFSEGHGAFLRIYLHTTENQDWMTRAEDVADYQARTQNDPNRAGSYHYIVDDDHIINTVATKDTAWGLSKDNAVSVQIAMVATSGAKACWGCQSRTEENPNVQHRPKSREQWLAHDKMLDMVAFTIATVATEYDIPVEWLDVEAVGNNRKGVSSHCNYSYGSVLLYGEQDSTHWDVPDTFPHDVVLDAAKAYVENLRDGRPIPASGRPLLGAAGRAGGVLVQHLRRRAAVVEGRLSALAAGGGHRGVRDLRLRHQGRCHPAAGSAGVAGQRLRVGEGVGRSHPQRLAGLGDPWAAGHPAGRHRSRTARGRGEEDQGRHRAAMDGPAAIPHGGNRSRCHGAHSERTHPGGVRRYLPRAVRRRQRVASTGRAALRHEEP